jgi:hypothetical protein
MAVLQRLALRGTPKATKQAARYTPAGGAERCGMCRHFAPSSSCARIEGPVSAAGWCQLYSQQVAWRPRAGQLAGLNPGLVPPGVTLDLSFMAPGTLPPNVVFTRASTAAYFDATGTMQTAAVNAPRWDYTGGSLRGLLIEEARTNIVLNSGDASNASWVKSNGGIGLPVATANQAVAPDGTTTAARVSFPAVSSAGDWSLLNPIISFTATVAPWTLSMWLRGNVGGERVYLSFTPDGVLYYRTTCNLTTSWQRFTLSTPNLTAATWFIEVGTDRRDASQLATSAQTTFIWGGQLEAGAFPTSYIPTTAASVTRAVEVCSIPTAAWFTPSVASLFYEIMLPLGGANTFGGFCDTNFGNAFYIGYVGPGSGVSVNRASGLSAPPTQALVPGINKVCGVISAAGVEACANGGTVQKSLGATTTLATSTRLAIGNDPWSLTTAINTWIRRVRYWPRVLSDAELQSVTT